MFFCFLLSLCYFKVLLFSFRNLVSVGFHSLLTIHPAFLTHNLFIIIIIKMTKKFTFICIFPHTGSDLCVLHVLLWYFITLFMKSWTLGSYVSVAQRQAPLEMQLFSDVWWNLRMNRVNLPCRDSLNSAANNLQKENGKLNKSQWRLKHHSMRFEVFSVVFG